MPNEPMRKCAECGFLAQRVYLGSVPQGFIEIDEEARATGDLPGHGQFVFHQIGTATPDTHSGDRYPTCFARAVNLQKRTMLLTTAELPEKDRRGGSIVSEVKYVLNQWQHSCAEFTPWVHGFTPKEHREMIDREFLLKREDARDKADHDWRDKQAEAERVWRTNQAAQAQEWRKEDIKLEAKARNENRWTNIIIGVVVFSAVTLGASGLGAWMQNRSHANTTIVNQIVLPTPQSTPVTGATPP